jgi:hypothetical protein
VEQARFGRQPEPTSEATKYLKSQEGIRARLLCFLQCCYHAGKWHLSQCPSLRDRNHFHPADDKENVRLPVAHAYLLRHGKHMHAEATRLLRRDFKVVWMGVGGSVKKS